MTIGLVLMTLSFFFSFYEMALFAVSFKMKLKLIFIILGFILGSEVHSSNDQTFAIKWAPVEYKVLLDMTDVFEKFTKIFRGEVTISGVTSSEIIELVLHSKVNVTEIYYVNSEMEKVNVDKNHTLQLEDGMLKLYLNSVLPKDSFFVINIKYTGELSDTSITFIPNYNNKHQFRPLIATNFQKFDARELFPCVDFPRFKAKFTLELLRPRWMKALSNMPRIKTTQGNLMFNKPISDTFNKSLPMSTYMFALVLLRDNYLNHTLRNGITIWFTKKDNVNFLEEAVPYLLDSLKDYTGISYILPKLDLVLIPNKSHESLGNWGLITWSLDMFDHVNFVGLDKLEYIYNFMGKEIAKYWFGNLVSCKDWCQIWVTECLSTYVSKQIVRQAFPDSTDLELFIKNTVMTAMADDSKQLLSLVNTDKCLENIDTMQFGTVHNNKGAAILHMVENNLMTKGNFKQAIHNYLTNKQFGVVDETQFWDSLEEVIDTSVKAKLFINKTYTPAINEVMKTWIYNKGYPLVKVSRLDGDIRVTQGLFSKPVISSNEYWWIPLTYTTSKEKNFNNLKVKQWIQPTHKLQELDLQLSDDEWVVLNIQHAGFYRILYDDRTYQLISDHLINQSMHDIHPLNRAQILNDAFECASENLLSLSTVLNLTTYLRKEEHYLPLSVGMEGLLKLSSQAVDENLKKKFTNFMRSLVADNYMAVFLNKLKENKVLNHFYHIKLVELACQLDFYHCTDQATKLAYSIINNKGKKYQLIPELKYTLWCSAVRVGSTNITKYLLRKFKSTPNGEEAITYAKYLLCSKDPYIITQVLNHLFYKSTFSENIVTQLRDFITPLDSNCMLLNFLEENFELILSKIGWEGIIEFLQDAYNKVKARAIFCEMKIQQISLFHQIYYPWPRARAWDKKHGGELNRWFSQHKHEYFAAIIIANPPKNMNVFLKRDDVFFEVPNEYKVHPLDNEL
ncbi:aminopeptidase N-like [Cimex lectularius]|uniref:Aminopeptidase n=1 Tax=Cimex lectularius TaxID=79782 RepID=A0A8I6S1M1_CIMLE|nr:aminopeptidase N-like [Cimex lectularius]